MLPGHLRGERQKKFFSCYDLCTMLQLIKTVLFVSLFFHSYKKIYSKSVHDEGKKEEANAGQSHVVSSPHCSSRDSLTTGEGRGTTTARVDSFVGTSWLQRWNGGCRDFTLKFSSSSD